MKKLAVFLLALFCANFASAEYIMQNVSNGCYDDTIFIENDTGNLYAVFTPNSHTCGTGYFLPANVDECRACGVEHTCVGGTFTFDENASQGITWTRLFTQSSANSCVSDFLPIDNNNNSVLYATFVPNTHTCSAGQYLPVNVDACTQCPAGSYCAGGTFTFNENTSQGIENCATGYSSPVGSDAASDCTANIITIIWAGASAGDIATNNAGTVTYGGDIRTPKHAPHINGKIFVGWTFNEPSGN